MNWKSTMSGLGMALLLTACDEPVAGWPGAATDAAPRSGAAQPFLGGFFEASGVVHVANSGTVLIVDDNRPGEVMWMKLDSAGAPTGRPQLVPLGVEVPDPEGITFDGQRYYVIGSQSAKKSGRKNGLVRFKFDATTGRATEVEGIPGVRELLVARFPSVPGLAEPGGKDGLNIEGLAWHPAEAVLLLGLRSPRAGSDAVIFKLRLQDPVAPLSVRNLEVAGPPVFLALDGTGIRGLEYDATGDRFLIISGPTEQQGNRPFALWEWRTDVVRRVAYLDAGLKPEGVSTRADSVVIVCDASSHLTLSASGLTSP